MSGDTVTIGGSSFHIEPLRGHENWMPWKRRMMAMFRELDLSELIADGAREPVLRNPSMLTEEGVKTIKAWIKRDEKVSTRIELAVADSEFVHLLGADTA